MPRKRDAEKTAQAQDGGVTESALADLNGENTREEFRLKGVHPVKVLQGHPKEARKVVGVRYCDGLHYTVDVDGEAKWQVGDVVVVEFGDFIGETRRYKVSATEQKSVQSPTSCEKVIVVD